jgi:hypothetical protein
MKDGSIKTPDSAVISTLVQNGSKIANLSDDELGFENDGVTKKDIIALDKLSGSDTIKDKVENTYYNSLYKATSGKSFLILCKEYIKVLSGCTNNLFKYYTWNVGYIQYIS